MFVMHLFGVILAYLALGIDWFWFFQSYLPFPKSLMDSVLLAAGVCFVLPLIGILYIKNHYFYLSKYVGTLYIVLWVITLLRFVDIILKK